VDLEFAWGGKVVESHSCCRPWREFRGWPVREERNGWLDGRGKELRVLGMLPAEI
jgi:hypothetical protein